MKFISSRVERITKDRPELLEPKNIKYLMWEIWKETGRIKIIDGEESITKEDFMLAIQEQSVNRCRRMMANKS